MNTAPTSKSNRRSIRVGAILIAVGIWSLINQLGIDGIWFGSSWPLILVLIGLAMAIVPSPSEGRREGIMLMVWGGLFWIAVHQLWGLGWSTIWPMFLVALGLELIWQALSRRQPAVPETESVDHE